MCNLSNKNNYSLRHEAYFKSENKNFIKQKENMVKVVHVLNFYAFTAKCCKFINLWIKRCIFIKILMNDSKKGKQNLSFRIALLNIKQ